MCGEGGAGCMWKLREYIRISYFALEALQRKNLLQNFEEKKHKLGILGVKKFVKILKTVNSHFIHYFSQNKS